MRRPFKNIRPFGPFIDSSDAESIMWEHLAFFKFDDEGVEEQPVTQQEVDELDKITEDIYSRFSEVSFMHIIPNNRKKKIELLIRHETDDINVFRAAQRIEKFDSKLEISDFELRDYEIVNERFLIRHGHEELI